MDVKSVADQIKNKRKGYSGKIEARGKICQVVDGHAEQDGQRIFIEEDGTVLKDGKVVGHVAPGKLTKGAPA